MTAGTCSAAVPLTLRDYTGRMTGGDPVTETVTDYWAECGQPSIAVHEYQCEHGHVVRKETCVGLARSAAASATTRATSAACR